MTYEDLLRNKIACFKDEVKHLLLEYSSLYYSNPSNDNILFIEPSGYHFWKELSEEGKQLQSKLIQQYSRLNSILTPLIDLLSETDRHTWSDDQNTIIQVIQQEGNTWIKSTQGALDKVDEAFSSLNALLGYIHSDKEKHLFIPDTNALLDNPNMAEWKFEGVEHFIVVLMPTILSELDSLKINHRVDTVREKSKAIIRQIKEYRRRGSLEDGVEILKSKVRLLSIALEPRIPNSLDWLDLNNNDDRFLASVIEIIRHNIRSFVTIVTSDINLQNKADYACIPYIEPPEPAKGKPNMIGERL